MNYYQHHLGDWAEATAHLTMLEDAAYSRLVRKYYATEAPMPIELAAVQRLVGARTKEEREAVVTVLREFFALGEDGWRNKRCDEEIAAYRDKSSKAKASASARWDAGAGSTSRNAKAMRTHTERNADAMPAQCEGNALQEPIANSQEPIATHTIPKRASACNYEWFSTVKAAYPAGTFAAVTWLDAERAVGQLIEEGETAETVLQAVTDFAAQQKAMGRIGTQFITSPNKFFRSGAWRGPFPLPQRAKKPTPAKPDLTGWMPPEYRNQEGSDVQA